MAENTIGSLKIGQAKCVLEARVYRKWVSKSIPQKKEIAFCCILIDRENNAIQANMDVNNTNYFNPLLQMQMVYRITNFTCENTKPYLQTLENKISLKFGKITSFHALPEKQSEFPEHHFEFVAYNQLSSRVPYLDENSKTVYPRLTDYLGCIRSISDITPFGNANTGQGWFRKVDIENLDGNVVEFTMWDDLAKQFNKEEIEKLSRPIIIVVSSCKVSKYRATSATYYSINPQTPEAKYAYTKYRYENLEQEKLRNRQTLHTLIQQNPETFQKIEAGTMHPVASAKKINESRRHLQLRRPWNTGTTHLQATVSDATAVAYFTFFTKAGEKIVGSPCSKLVARYKSMDQRQLPVDLVNIIGKTQIFQIHFTPSARQGSGQFMVVDILDIQPALETERQVSHWMLPQLKLPKNQPARIKTNRVPAIPLLLMKN
ncbi:nucleic acid-binding, OB-fold protein [Tanacetum coccineum]